MSMDEASSNYSLYYFLSYHLKLTVVVTPDPGHRAWNDIKIALAGARLWPHVLLASLPFKVAHTPWGTGAVHEQTKSAMEEFVQNVGPLGPLFQPLPPRFLRDFNWEDKVGEADLSEQVWQRMLDAKCLKFIRGLAPSSAGG